MILKIWDDEYLELYLALRRARARGVRAERRPRKRRRMSREDGKPYRVDIAQLDLQS